MKILRNLAFLAVLAIFLFNGCKKESIVQSGSTLTGKITKANAVADSLTLTPERLAS